MKRKEEVTSEQARAERLFVRFKEAEEAESEDFETWLAAQSELEHDDELVRRVRALRHLDLRVDSLLDRARDDRDVIVPQSPRAGTADPRQALRPGRTIGDFRLVRFLGRGGMGQVWAAEQKSLRRVVALKLVLSDRADAHGLELFSREARAGGRLHHPNIVETLTTGVDDGLAWIAQDLVEGAWTLKQFIDDLRARPELPRGHYRSVAMLVRKIALALQCAHDAGIVHRDVKPQNVLLTAAGEPKLTDFGLARIIDEASLSETGEFAGTYYYMSPEQVAAKRTGIDHRTDVFSLGVVLYELLTLRRPFEGDTAQQICSQIVFVDPADVRRIRSQCPADLAVICARALEKAPDERFQSVADMAADLSRHLANEPIRATPPTRIERVRKWVRRNPSRALAAAIAAIAFLAVSTLGLLLQGRSQALQARTSELSSANEALTQRERELTGANEDLTMERRAAEEARRRAQASFDDVLRLSDLQDVEDLLAREAQLWPPWPERIDALREWIVDARALVARLPEHRARRETLRQLALPQSEQERSAELASHPDGQALVRIEEELLATRRALARRRRGEDVGLPRVERERYPSDARRLNAVAASLVAPDRALHGREPLGLALALCALEVAEGDDVATVGRTVAWACFALGRDDEALDACFAAREASSDGRRAEFDGLLTELEGAIARTASPEGLEQAERALVVLEERRSELLARVQERRDWRFPEDADEARWWNNQLTKLIEELNALDRDLLHPLAVTEAHGWSVTKRLAFAEQLRDAFAPNGQYAAEWSEALPAIQEAYAGLRLEPQMALVPLGPDPVSGLWEFAELTTGEPPRRSELGTLVLTDETGLVLVLLPGGAFRMGAQASDPQGWNYDPAAAPREGPVHEVALAPFLLSKYEMTQSQWSRLTGNNPSHYRRGNLRRGHVQPTPLHPVEQVSWLDSMRWLPRAGLILATESQWEFGARAGTDTPWWSGPEPKSLRERNAANLADLTAVRVGTNWDIATDGAALDDGHAFHAPVGTYAANPFGLHDTCGNVAEWCLDELDAEFYWRSPEVEPVAATGTTVLFVVRGGSYFQPPSDARSACRNYHSEWHAEADLGLRPARSLMGDAERPIR